jgi:shikimate dehydrogenase
MSEARHAGVIGWPIEHSRSPMIHSYWLQKYGIAGSYERHAVRPEELEGFIASFGKTGPGTQGLVGCNITAPHKEAAFRLCAARGAEIDENATIVGAVNTLWVDAAGGLHATSTDAYGLMTHLMMSVPELDLKARPVMVLGAGGAAQSVVWALRTAGAGTVRVANRSIERAQQLARGHSGTHIEVVEWDRRSDGLNGCALLVNATTLGMAKQPPLEIMLEALPADAVVYDIVYVPLATELLKAARQRGLRVVDGLGMLLHQAVPGFQRWFGTKPEVTDELRAILVADIEKH